MFPKIRLNCKALIRKNPVNYSVVNLTRFPNAEGIDPVNSLLLIDLLIKKEMIYK